MPLPVQEGNESRLTGRRSQDLGEVLVIERGALSAALD
jgi:hypothetical protein